MNFLIVDLRDDLVSGDLIYAMRTLNMLYDTKLLMSAYLKIIDLKMQYCTGRELLLFLPSRGMVYEYFSRRRSPYRVVQQKSVIVTPSGMAKKCHCKRMAYTVSL